MSDSDEEFFDKRPYFEPFSKKTTHWGDPSHRPRIANVAYVLPPDLKGAKLQMALFRMQIEEIAFEIKHQNEEASYSIWKESFIDSKSWYNNIPLAVKEKSREILAREMKTTITSFDQEFPSIIKRPPFQQSFRRYHLYNPNEGPKKSKYPYLPKLNEYQMKDKGNLFDDDSNTTNDEAVFQKKKSFYDDSDDEHNPNDNNIRDQQNQNDN